MARVQFAELYSNVTLLFCDIVGFTSMSEMVEPVEVVALLHDLHVRWDALCVKWPVYKVDTVGDTYIAATGLMHNDPHHAETMLCFAIDMLQAVQKVKMPHNGQPPCVRIGIHTGSVLGGVVGRIRRKFSVWGDDVNVASRLESSGVVNRIHVSDVTYALLRHLPQYSWQCRGEVQLKGRRSCVTHLLKTAQEAAANVTVAAAAAATPAVDEVGEEEEEAVADVVAAAAAVDEEVEEEEEV